MSDLKTSKDGAWAWFDGMTWPLPSDRLGEAEGNLRRGEATRADILLSASAIRAYRQMIADPKRKRDAVVRRLREAMQTKEET